MDRSDWNVLKAYERIVFSDDGALVMTDLKQAYMDDGGRMTEDERQDIPHPYRAYYLLGQQSLINKLERAAQYSTTVSSYTEGDVHET